MQRQSGDLFRIICCSGGGFRGVYSLEVLRQVHRLYGDRKRSLTDAGDAFVGTSVGAIIAAGLAFGLKPHEIQSIFFRHGREIFAGPNGPGLWGAKYRTEVLRDVLKEAFQDKSFNELDKPCFVTTIDAETGNTLIMGGSKHFKQHYADMKIHEALLLSIAAPTYFPMQKCDKIKNDQDNAGSNGWAVDGGLTANAPELLTVLRLAEIFGLPLGRFFILSVGTLDHKVQLKGKVKMRPPYVFPRGEKLTWPKVLTIPWRAFIWAISPITALLSDLLVWIRAKCFSKDWGAFQWLSNGRVSLVELLLRGQEKFTEDVFKKLVPKSRYLRLNNAELEFDQRIELDDFRAFKKLRAHARDTARKVSSRTVVRPIHLSLFFCG